MIEINNEKITLAIWDTAGQEKFLSLTPNYIRNADGVIFCFDPNAQDSLRILDSIYGSIQEQLDPIMAFVLCANKIDNVDVNRDYSSFISWGKQRKINVFAKTSAKTGYGVNEVFSNIAEQIYEKKKKVNPTHIVALKESGENKCC